MKPDLDTAIQEIQNNELSKADNILNELEKTSAKNPQYWNIKALLAIQKNSHQQAIEYLQNAIDLNDKEVSYYCNQAICHRVLNQYGQAEDALRKALRIEPNNENIKQMFLTIFDVSHNNQQLLVDYLNNQANAAALYEIALDFAKRFQVHKALHFYQQAVKKDPDNSLYLLNYFQAASVAKQFKEGIIFLQSLRDKMKNPSQLNVFLAFLTIRKKTWHNYQENLDVILKDTHSCLAEPNKIANVAPFHSLFVFDDPKLNLNIAKRISACVPHFKYEYQPEPSQINKKLRVGFLSSDFRNHPVAHLCRNLFFHLNKNDIENYLYATSMDDNSEYRKHFEETATCFKDVSGQNEQEIAKLIHDDNVDILVDMQGLTANIIISLFAYRPAPVQIEYLGYPGTTGADYLDYIIVDKIIAPKQDQQYYTEKFIYMPHCYQVNDDEQAIASESMTKAQFGLPEDKFIYCCFNNTYKIEPTIFKVWMNILKAVPDSIFWLLSSTPEEDGALRQHAKDQGVDPNRIIFAERIDKDKHLRRLQLADLFLDTYIVGAHTTASDSLWAGVPILTCTGDRFVSRVCTSLLKTQGLDELITDNLQAYQHKAIYYGQHPEEITKLKEKIQQTNKTMPLFNTEQYAKDFAKALRLAWERYCNDLPPDIIEVE